jgi:hypothetical protein
LYLWRVFIFWNITPCCPLKVNWCIWDTFRLHLQDRTKGWLLST